MRAMAGNAARAQVPLNLYRRHRQRCEGDRAAESRSGEFDERKKGRKRCGCVVFVSGTLDQAFARKATGTADRLRHTASPRPTLRLAPGVASRHRPPSLLLHPQSPRASQLRLRSACISRTAKRPSHIPPIASKRRSRSRSSPSPIPLVTSRSTSSRPADIDRTRARRAWSSARSTDVTVRASRGRT
jgi:hypothetical protein